MVYDGYAKPWAWFFKHPALIKISEIKVGGGYCLACFNTGAGDTANDSYGVDWRACYFDFFAVQFDIVELGALA